MPEILTVGTLARVRQGVSYCALFNRRQEGDAPSFAVIDPLLGEASSAITSWPATDLTPRHF